MTHEGAPSGASRVRCRYAIALPGCPLSAHVVPLHDVKERRFFVPASRPCARVLCFLSSQPTPNRGAGGAPGGALPNVSRSYGATSRLRGVSRPAQPGRRLSALHRGVVGPGPAPSPALPPDPARRLLVGQAVVLGCGPGRLVSAGYEPRSTPLPAPPSGSSPEDAPHERGCESIARIRYVVNTEVTT